MCSNWSVHGAPFTLVEQASACKWLGRLKPNTVQLGARTGVTSRMLGCAIVGGSRLSSLPPRPERQAGKPATTGELPLSEPYRAEACSTDMCAPEISDAR